MATGPRLMAGWIFPKPAKSWNHIQSQSFILRSLAGGAEVGLTRLGYGKWQACNHSRSFGKTGEIFFRQAFPDTVTICRKKGNKGPGCRIFYHLKTVARGWWRGFIISVCCPLGNPANDQRFLIKWRQRWSSDGSIRWSKVMDQAENCHILHRPQRTFQSEVMDPPTANY